MKLLAASASASACLCLLAAPSAKATHEGALHRCASRAELLDQLASSYDEKPRAWHLMPSGLLIEFLASVGVIWTVIGALPAHDYCILGSGVGARVPVVGAL